MKDNWDKDMSNAPLDGSPVILATKCGKVIKSQYMPSENRWLMLGKNEVPTAWQLWPEHPVDGMRR